LWKDEHWHNLNEFLSSYFNVEPEHSSHIAFSELTEPQQTLAKLLTLNTEVKIQVQSLFERFTHLNQDKEATEFSIARAENAEDSNAYLDELLQKERKLGELDLILNQKDEERRKLSWEVVTAERNLKASSEAVAEFELQNHKNSLAAKGIKALIDFEIAL